ncbi:hypothetical protein ACYJ1Y_02915 [Natrialbaceae archaeon A-gly3]
MSDEISRRNLLRNGGVGLLAIGTAGMAGCLDDVPVVASSVSGPLAEEWLANLQFDAVHDEDELENDYDDVEIDGHEDPEVTFDYVVPQAVFDHEEELDGYGLLEWHGSGLRDRIDVPAIELDWQLQQRTEWDWEFSYTEEQTNWQGTVIGSEERTNTTSTRLSVDVFSGAFVTEDVEEALEDWVDEEYDDEDLSSEGEYQEFDLYEIDGRGFAVRTDYVIQANPASYVDPLPVLEATVDARFEGEDRLLDDEDAGDLLAHHDAGDFGNGEIHEPINEDRLIEERAEEWFGEDVDDLSEWQLENVEDNIRDIEDWESGLVGSATTMGFDGDTTVVTEVYLYEADRNANADALREHVESNRDVGDEWATLEDYSIDDDGRALILSGTVRTRAL